MHQSHEVALIQSIQVGHHIQAQTDAGTMFQEVAYEYDEAARKLWSLPTETLMDTLREKGLNLGPYGRYESIVF